MNGIFANYLWTMFWGRHFESCDFSRENTNIDVSVFMVDLRMINMSSECEYDWYWKISACSTEYEVCDSFASLTRQQTSYSGSAGWYFRYQSIHIQITYTYKFVDNNLLFKLVEILGHYLYFAMFKKITLQIVKKIYWKVNQRSCLNAYHFFFHFFLLKI